jgi:hypothetical protein
LIIDCNHDVSDVVVYDVDGYIDNYRFVHVQDETDKVDLPCTGLLLQLCRLSRYIIDSVVEEFGSLNFKLFSPVPSERNGWRIRLISCPF